MAALNIMLFSLIILPAGRGINRTTLTTPGACHWAQRELQSPLPTKDNHNKFTLRSLPRVSVNLVRGGWNNCFEMKKRKKKQSEWFNCKENKSRNWLWRTKGSTVGAMGACWHIRHYNTMASGELARKHSLSPTISNSLFIIDRLHLEKMKSGPRTSRMQFRLLPSCFELYLICELGRDFHIAIDVNIFA